MPLGGPALPPAPEGAGTSDTTWSGPQSTCSACPSPSALAICSPATAAPSASGGALRGNSARALNDTRDAPEVVLQSPSSLQPGVSTVPSCEQGNFTVTAACMQVGKYGVKQLHQGR